MCLPLRYTLQQAPFLVHSVLGLVSNRTGYEILDCLTVETIGTLDFFCKADLECRAEFSKHLIPFKIQQSEVRRNNFVLQSLWLLKKSLYSFDKACCIWFLLRFDTQYLFKELEIGDGMYWVVSGALDVLDHKGQVTSVLMHNALIGAFLPSLGTWKQQKNKYMIIIRLISSILVFLRRNECGEHWNPISTFFCKSQMRINSSLFEQETLPWSFTGFNLQASLPFQDLFSS